MSPGRVSFPPKTEIVLPPVVSFREQSTTGNAAGGLRCPKCLCLNFAEVYRTVQMVDAVSRERRCRNCGTRLFTREIVHRAVWKKEEKA
jgi:DNA-directed RNA polymerase subunit RPC12/RpoP